jgi:hypothetical protein
MKRNEITVPRNIVYAIGFVILVIFLVIGGKSSPPTVGQSQGTTERGAGLAAGSAEQFAFLSGESGQRSVGST